ncbi:MAG: ATP-binding cassette domain-containing protein, partial [Methanobacteriota archaeon]
MNVKIDDLHVSVDGKEVVKGLSLSMEGGEVHAIMGPNGSGKSTLSYAIAGHPSYDVRGAIYIDGEDITEMEPHERAKKGVFLSFQNPPFVEGVPVLNLLKKSYIAVNGLDERDISIYKEFNERVNKA